jgi:ATP-dependent DNA helicase RecG
MGDVAKSTDELLRLLADPFDSRPNHEATLNDLDLGLFEREYLPSVLPPDVLAPNGRTSEQRLAALRLTTVNGTPTNAGVLILGIEPTRSLPGAYVQFLRVEGTELSDPIIDERRLSSALPGLLRELDEVIRLNIRTSVTIGEGYATCGSPTIRWPPFSNSPATRCCTVTMREPARQCD